MRDEEISKERGTPSSIGLLIVLFWVLVMLFLAGMAIYEIVKHWP